MSSEWKNILKEADRFVDLPFYNFLDNIPDVSTGAYVKIKEDFHALLQLKDWRDIYMSFNLELKIEYFFVYIPDWDIRCCYIAG